MNFRFWKKKKMNPNPLPLMTLKVMLKYRPEKYAVIIADSFLANEGVFKPAKFFREGRLVASIDGIYVAGIIQIESPEEKLDEMLKREEWKA